MSSLKKTKAFPTLSSIHTLGEKDMLDFLNNNSKYFGSIKYLGSFIEDLKIKNDTGLKSTSNFLIIHRETESDSSPGDQYIKVKGPVPDIFEFPYELPSEFPKKPTAKENFIIPNSIETFSCDPKQKCSTCNGSGECQSCNGVGKKICGRCKGTKKIDVRDGLKANKQPKYRRAECPSCSGSGKVLCSSCKGSKKCGTCSGTGKVTCTRCEGTGKYQEYLLCLTNFRSHEAVKNFAEVSDLIKAIPDTKNKTGFDDVMVEWKDYKSLKIDNRSYLIKENIHTRKIIDELDQLANLCASERIGRVKTYFETVPITELDFKFESKEYRLYIVGENNIVCYYDIPKKHSYSGGVFSKIFNLLTKKKRQIAFLYLASFMFYADDTVDEAEENLFELFFNKTKINPEKRSLLISGLKRKNSLEQIMPFIKCVRKDKRALVFAWHCVIQNEQINEKEITAFNELASYFNIPTADAELIKNKAKKFRSLTSEQMFELYFN